MAESVRLMLGDCIERMGEIEAGSVDLIAADLPYQVTACQWDTMIPFGPMWAAFRRILKPRGSVVLTAAQPFTTDLVNSNRDWFKYALVWEKTKATGFLNAPYRPLSAHEDICVFSGVASTYSPNPGMTYNPQFGVGEPYSDKRTSRKPDKFAFHAQPFSKISVSNKTERYPRSVIKVPFEQGSHNTQKPVALFEYLVCTYSNEGETVLDCTMGSGTTGIACVNTGRSFIGIERDAGYFRIATDRIAAAQSATPLLSAR